MDTPAQENAKVEQISPPTPPPAPKKKSPVLLVVIVLLAAVVALGAYFLFQPSEKKQEAPKFTGPIEQIRIGNIGEYSIFNIIAKEKGIFNDHGLDAQIQEYASGPPAVASLSARAVDIAVAADFVGVINIAKDPSIRIISQASKHKVFHVVARVDHGINNPEDLKKKKIGVTKKSAGEFFLGRFLTFNNLTAEDVTIVDLPPPEMIKQFTSGTLDAVLIFDPHAFNLKKQLGDKVVSWSAQGDQDTFAVIYSRSDFIDKNPEIIRRYLTSLSEAQHFIQTNPREAQDMIVRLLKYEEDYIENLWKNFSFGIGLDQELLLTMEDQSEYAISYALVPDKTVPNYLNFIYFDGLEQVRPAAINIIH